MLLLFANNASSNLAGAISNTATSCALTTGTGALFPNPGTDQYFKATLNDQATGSRYEIVHVTAISGDTITTMVRGQEGTQAQSWAAGDLFLNFETAGSMSAMAQMPTTAGNPNGIHAGQAATAIQGATQLWDTVNQLVWVCTTSGNATGAVWVSPEQVLVNSVPFGSFINAYYNGSCAVAQRGTSVTVTAGTQVYTLDGFLVGCTGANVTVTQGPSVGIGPNAITITGQVGVTDCWVIKPIESIDAFRLASSSGNILHQCKMLNNTGSLFIPTITVKHPVSSPDVWSTSTTMVSAVALPSAAAGQTTLLDYLFSSATTVQNGLSVRIDFGGALSGAGHAVSLGDWDIRSAGNQILTAPVPEIRAYVLELLQCQRYLPSLDSTGTTSHMYFSGGGYWDASNAGEVVLQFFTRCRANVTGVTYSALSDFNVNYRGGIQAVSSLTFDSNNVGPFFGTVQFVSTGPATSGEVSNLIGVTSSARIYFTGAELNGTAI